MAALGALTFLVSFWVSDDLTFFVDEWNIVLRDPSWSAEALFAPLNEHIYVAPVVIYKLLLGAGGMESTDLFRAANALLLVSVVLFVFAYVKERLGLGLAVALALILGLLGPAWEDLLWSAGISFLGALAAGLAAFRATERESLRGDLTACLLLLVSVSFSTLGLVFVVGVIIDIVLGERERRARIYVPMVPVLAYLAWYVSYGKDAEGSASLENFLDTPLYVWNSASAGIASLLGLTGISEESLGASAEFGRPLLVLAVAGAIWLIAREPALLTRRLWIAVGTALTFWSLAGLNAIPGREPGASRYQLISAVLIVLIAAELLRGRRLRGAWMAPFSVFVLAAVISNLGALRAGEQFLRGESDSTLATLAAVDLARASISADYVFEPAASGPFPQPVPAATYFGAVDRWGSPAAFARAPGEAPEPARLDADAQLAAALGLGLDVEASAAPAAGVSCSEYAVAPSAAAVDLMVPAGGAEFRLPGGAAAVALRRWAQSSFPVDLGPSGEDRFTLAIPADQSPDPWIARLEPSVGGGTLRVCPLAER